MIDMERARAIYAKKKPFCEFPEMTPEESRWLCIRSRELGHSSSYGTLLYLCGFVDDVDERTVSKAGSVKVLQGLDSTLTIQRIYEKISEEIDDAIWTLCPAFEYPNESYKTVKEFLAEYAGTTNLKGE